MCLSIRFLPLFPDAVVGSNSVPDAACNFRCDRCYLLPLTATAEYPARMREILLEQFSSHIVLRDEDTFALSQLKSQHPELPGGLPVAEPRAALIGVDKWHTWLFTRKHSLPFAESFMLDQSGERRARHSVTNRLSPDRQADGGAGSRGVCFVRDVTMPSRWHNDHIMCSRNTSAIRGAWSRTSQPFRALRRCLPSSRTPGTTFADTVISPSSDIAPIVVTENHTNYGHTTLNRRILD